MLSKKETWDLLKELGVVTGSMPDGPFDPNGINLKGVEFENTNFERANLEGANLSNSNLGGAIFYLANLKRANLSGAYLGGADFAEADLTEADLRKCEDITEASWDEAIVTNAKMSYPGEQILLCAEYADVPSYKGEPVIAPDSFFEEDVIRAIKKLGYIVDIQIPVGQYRIDIAVADKLNPPPPPESGSLLGIARANNYILGIECDSAEYHSDALSRRNDQQRQVAIEEHGWQIYRIWGPDWFNNKEKEIRKLNDTIREAQERKPQENQRRRQEMRQQQEQLRAKETWRKVEIDEYNRKLFWKIYKWIIVVSAIVGFIWGPYEIAAGLSGAMEGAVSFSAAGAFYGIFVSLALQFIFKKR